MSDSGRRDLTRELPTRSAELTFVLERSEEVAQARDTGRLRRKIDLTHEFPTASAELSVVFQTAEKRLSLSIERSSDKALILSVLAIIAAGVGLIIGLVTNFALDEALTILGAVFAGAVGSAIGFFLSSRTERQERVRLEALQARLRRIQEEPGHM